MSLGSHNIVVSLKRRGIFNDDEIGSIRRNISVTRNENCIRRDLENVEDNFNTSSV